MTKAQSRKLQSIVEALKREFKPQRMFLFGSRTNGTARPDSDYDFVLVIKGNKKSRLTNLSRARELLSREFSIAADVFVYSQREFDEWKDDFSSIPETAVKTGLEIDLG